MKQLADDTFIWASELESIAQGLQRKEADASRKVQMRINLKQLMADTTLLLIGYALGCLLVQHGRLPPLPFLPRQCPGPGRVGAGGAAPFGPRPQIEDTLMIGVMTTRRNLATRASAIDSTWGREAAGRVVFYVGEASHSPAPDPRNSTARSAPPRRPRRERPG